MALWAPGLWAPGLWAEGLWEGDEPGPEPEPDPGLIPLTFFDVLPLHSRVAYLGSDGE